MPTSREYAGRHIRILAYLAFLTVASLCCRLERKLRENFNTPSARIRAVVGVWSFRAILLRAWKRLAFYPIPEFETLPK